MSASDIQLLLYARPNRAMTIDQRHAEVMDKMSKVGAPLGFSGLELPVAPSCGDGLVATYTVKLPIRGLRFVGDYIYRGESYIEKDRASHDEHLQYGFKTSNKAIDYSRLIVEDFPRLIEAFGGYKAHVAYDLYAMYYKGGLNDDNPIYNKLREDDAVDVDGRNNVYTLYPAQFWDANLCRRALGYDRDEVIKRLDGKCHMVIPLLDGVYVVLNHEPDMSYEDFLNINNKIKPILGLI